MRDKQSFEAYVLEKSKIEKNKIAMRRKTILTAGTALCVCLVVLMVLPGILEQPPMTDGFNGAQEALPNDGGSNYTTPMPTAGNVVGGIDDEGDGSSGTVEATEKPTRRPTIRPTRRPTIKPEATSDKNYVGAEKPTPPTTQEALPLDEAFAQKKSDYAIPDRIECLKDGATYSITEMPILCDICDWVMEGTFVELDEVQPESTDWTIIIYYGQDSITCYLSESGLFKLGESAWLETDPAYVSALLDCFGG